MISREIEAEILRLYHAEGWRVGTLARQLHVHRSVVRRVCHRPAYWSQGVIGI